MAFGSFPLGDGALGGDGPGLNSYVLAAEAGAFAVTGSPASLLADRKLTAEPGAYSVAGDAAVLLATRRLPADSGAFAVDGPDASLLCGRRINAESGVYEVVGTDATLLAARILRAEGGAFVIDGTAAALLYGWRLAAGPGVFTISGFDAHLSVALHRPSSILRPKVATFQRGRKAISSSGDDSLVTWDPYLSGAPVDVQPLSGSQRQREYGRSVESTHAMYADAAHAAGLLVGDRVAESSTTYLVTFIAVRGAHVEADLASVPVV